MDAQQSSSDEEIDVFECGRCREKFTELPDFMQHKSSRVCRKLKDLSGTDATSSDAAVVKEPQNQDDDSKVHQRYGYPMSGGQYPPVETGRMDHHQAQVYNGSNHFEDGQYRPSNQLPSIPPTDGREWISHQTLMKLTASISEAVDASIGGTVDTQSHTASESNQTAVKSLTSSGDSIIMAATIASGIDNLTDASAIENIADSDISTSINNPPETNIASGAENLPDASVASGTDNLSETSVANDTGNHPDANDTDTLNDTSSDTGNLNDATIATAMDNLAAAAMECQKQDQQMDTTSQPASPPQESSPMQPSADDNDTTDKVEDHKDLGGGEEEDDEDMVEISLAMFDIECSFCSSAFTNQVDLKNHLATTHRIEDQQANKLAEEIGHKSTIKKKKAPVKKSPGRPRGNRRLPTDCQLCNKVFSCRKNFLKHNKSKHHLAKLHQQYMAEITGKRLKKCNHCPFSASNAKDLTDHLKNAHASYPLEPEQKVAVAKKRGRGRPRKPRPLASQKPYDVGNELGTCPECGKEMKNKVLSLHVPRCRSKTTLANCSECGKSVMKKALYRHQRRCLNKKHLVCPLCEHQSRERYDYSVHINNHRTWLPAEPGDVPPKQEEPVNDEPLATQDESSGQQQGSDGVKEQTESGDNTEDTISTLDLSVLGLTPTQTAPMDQGSNNEEQQMSMALLGMSPTESLQHDTQGQSDKTASNEIAGMNSMDTAPNGIKSSGDILYTEVKRNINQKQLKCHSCENWYQRANFKHHMYAVHNLVKKFQCRQEPCNIAITLLDDFLEHAKGHGDQLAFTCGCRNCIVRTAKLENPDPEYVTKLKKQKLKEYYQGMIYKCNKCWVKFPSPEGLEKHLRKESHSHPCPVCGKVQVSKRQLRMHAVTHADERNYLCEECGSSFKTTRDLKKHSMSHSEFKPFICQECGKGFLFKNKLVRHQMTVHSNEKPFKCTFQNCEKAFSRRDKLNDHARTHLYYEPFHCRFCPKGFFRKDNLKDHEVLHTKEYRFKCEQCPKGFMRPKLLARHVAHEHGLPYTGSYDESNGDSPNGQGDGGQDQLTPLKLTKPKVRSRSKAPAASKKSVETQAQNLSQITYMIYQQAGSSMAAALQQAMQSVNQGADGCSIALPPEVLQAYQMAQQTKDQQQTQLMFPPEFDPFICEDCGKGFLFRDKLNRHRLSVHSTEKPFKCTFETCEKAFARKDKLKDHARTHLNYEPFHCRFCPKGFFRKDNLKDHEVLHTKDYPFKCDLCPKGFMRPHILARHIKHEHASIIHELGLGRSPQKHNASRVTPENSVPRVTSEQDVPRVAPEQDLPRVTTEQNVPRVSPEQEVSRVTPEHSVQRGTHEHGASRVTHEHGASRVTPEQGVPLVMSEQAVTRVIQERSIQRGTHEHRVSQVTHEHSVPHVTHEHGLPQGTHEQDMSRATPDHIMSRATPDHIMPRVAHEHVIPQVTQEHNLPRGAHEHGLSRLMIDDQGVPRFMLDHGVPRVAHDHHMPYNSFIGTYRTDDNQSNQNNRSGEPSQQFYTMK